MTKMLKKALEGHLTEDESKELFSAFDQIGDIIVVRIPESLLSKKKIIGQTLLNEVKTARSVYYQLGLIDVSSLLKEISNDRKKRFMALDFDMGSVA